MSINTSSKHAQAYNETDELFKEISISYAGELYVVIAFLSLLSVIGTAGNGIVLYVYTKKKDTLVSTQCIIALATVDFVTCFLVIPCTIYMEYTDFHLSSDFFCKLYQFLITSSIPFSALIMVAIALDRYLCICHPFVKLLTVGRSKVMICVLWMIAGCLGVCVALMFSVYERMEKLSQTTDSFHDEVIWSSFTIDYETAILLPVLAPNNSTDTEYSDQSSDTSDFIIGNSGHCKEADLIITKEFFYYYQKLYNTIFPLCLVIVIILYILIYRSVQMRRKRRQKQKSKALLLVQSAKNNQSNKRADVNKNSKSQLNGESTTRDQNHLEPLDQLGDPCTQETCCPSGSLLQEQKPKSSRNVSKIEADEKKKSKADSTRMANIKTAAMLFVVNVVFFVSFLPAYLTTLGIIPFNLTVFYLYFANNVANPVIYSFMNKNFRADLAKLFGYTPR